MNYENVRRSFDSQCIYGDFLAPLQMGSIVVAVLPHDARSVAFLLACEHAQLRASELAVRRRPRGRDGAHGVPYADVTRFVDRS